MSNFNSHSHRLASPAFWRPIKLDSSPHSLTEGRQKAGKEQRSGMLKSSMMESVNSANGSLSPRCLLHFISRTRRWQKVFWTPMLYIQMISSHWAIFVLKAITKAAILVKSLILLIYLEHPSLLHIRSWFPVPPVILIILGNSICCKSFDNSWEWKIQFNNLLLQTHLQAQQDLGPGNNGWAFEALWMLLDHFWVTDNKLRGPMKFSLYGMLHAS